MKDEELFYEKRSDLVGDLMEYIELCRRIDREPKEEVDEIVDEAILNCE